MSGWASFVQAFNNQEDLTAIAAIFGGHAGTGHATVFVLVSWLLSLYAGVEAFYAEDPLPPPRPPPTPPNTLRLATMAGRGGD